MKVVINRCFGGFSLSKEAYEKLGIRWDGHGSARELRRNDPRLVEVVEKLGDRASGEHATLIIVEIPDDVVWEIEDYDGVETVHEKHRTWPCLMETRDNMKRSWRYHLQALLGLRALRLDMLRGIRMHERLAREERFWKSMRARSRSPEGRENALEQLHEVRIEMFLIREHLRDEYGVVVGRHLDGEDEHGKESGRAAGAGDDGSPRSVLRVRDGH